MAENKKIAGSVDLFLGCFWRSENKYLPINFSFFSSILYVFILFRFIWNCYDMKKKRTFSMVWILHILVDRAQLTTSLFSCCVTSLGSTLETYLFDFFVERRSTSPNPPPQSHTYFGAPLCRRIWSELLECLISGSFLLIVFF